MVSDIGLVTALLTNITLLPQTVLGQVGHSVVLNCTFLFHHPTLYDLTVTWTHEDKPVAKYVNKTIIVSSNNKRYSLNQPRRVFTPHSQLDYDNSLLTISDLSLTDDLSVYRCNVNHVYKKTKAKWWDLTSIMTLQMTGE
nr:ORF110 [Acipenserid herpesvirus 1]